MSSVVAELDTALQAMLALKAPGVSGSKISAITTLCTNNVQSESVIVQKIYTHFKKTPGTHKLGVLYVVDSVTRQWVDHARKTNQVIGTAAGDGTYAAGVNRVTELLPVLMSDIIQHAPEDQKEKIRKLVDIWERGSTFPAHLLASFKERLSAPPNTSTTPPGTPPKMAFPTTNAAPAPAPNTSAILEALANIAKQSTPAPPAAARAAVENQMNGSGAPPALPQPAAVPVNHAAAFPPTSQPVPPPMLAPHLAAQFPGLNLNPAAMANTGPPNPFAIAPPAPVAPTATAPTNPAGPEALQQQLMLVQLLMQQGVPQDQWGPIIAALSAGNANPAMPGMPGIPGMPGLPAAGAAPAAAWLPSAPPPNGWNPDMSRDRNGARDQPMRSPPPRRYRDRSRSPQAWGRDRDSTPPRRRDSPTYGEYSGDSPGRHDPYDRRGRGRGGRGRDEYRQRSPPPGRRGFSPNDRDRERDRGSDRWEQTPQGPKLIDYDAKLGKDNIKVLSRTLFVGGVTSNEDDLRNVFSRFGKVQTCIVNTDKRHAFIKMITRADAVAAKEGMEREKPTDVNLRTRWGVGFGPRDCSDYQTGISIIPIHRLTEADRKWMLNAEYGGSGGKPIEGGLVVEEPDIEIGAGVSSKAISRRMVTDQAGRSGPRSSRHPETGGGGGGGGRPRRERLDVLGPERDSVNASPLGVPASAAAAAASAASAPQPQPQQQQQQQAPSTTQGFSFPFANLAAFPPGFVFPGLPQPGQAQQGQQQQQQSSTPPGQN